MRSNFINYRHGRGFTLIELISVIAIIALLCILLFPFVESSINQAKAAKCSAQQRRIYLALIGYATEHNEFLPPYRDDLGSKALWFDYISPYLGYDDPSQIMLSCPAADPAIGAITYGVNYQLIFGNTSAGGSKKLLNIASSTYLFGDSESVTIYTPTNWGLNADPNHDGFPTSCGAFAVPYNYFSPRHNHRGILTFEDGSIRNISIREWAENEDNMWGPRP